MKFTPRKFFLFFTIIFSIICCWTILSFRSTIPDTLTSQILSSDKLDASSTINKLSQINRKNQVVNNVEAPVRNDQNKNSLSYKVNIFSKELNHEQIFPKPNKQKKVRQNAFAMQFSNIPCDINNEYIIDCLKNQENSSIYIPFGFIKKYFEINGKIVRNSKNQEFFDWNHSYSRIFYPDQSYSFSDKYLWFENYNVELRERVLCISAQEGVPISTQWFSKGHFYPTQIAQYGLSHFNKNHTEDLPKRMVLFQNTKFTKIVQNFDHSYQTDQMQPLTLTLSKPSFGHLIADFELEPLGHFNLTFHFNEISEDFILQHSLIYSTLIDSPFIKNFISTSNSNFSFTYGLSSTILEESSYHFARDLFVDLVKVGLTFPRKRSNFTVTKITFFGKIKIHSLALMTSAHEKFAIIAGNWFIKNQNELGGWEIKVRRKLQKNKSGTLILEPGWHSAMAQGQAMSLLVRLYKKTKDDRYLNSAKKALNLFKIESIQRGVRAKLFDKLTWFEEYPTVPSIFVLNGFIYSLFGLYDLSKACEEFICQEAEQIFMDGIHSLEESLLLFDTGSGSFYDLRHLALGGPPNIARWDYHSTHINQLLQLNTIVKRELFESTIERWTQYMKGHRAPHN